MNQILFVFLLVLTTRGLLADDFKTIQGKEYKNVTVRRVEPDGIVLATSFGISKVYFTELPKEVQERFHYDAAKGAAVSSQEAASIAEYNKRVTSQKQESPKNQQDTCQALLVRYTQLGHEKDDLYIRSGTPRYLYGR
jgi:hypothetical protein